MAITTYGQDSSQPNYEITETITSGNLSPGLQVAVDFSKFPAKALVIAALDQIKAHITVAEVPL